MDRERVRELSERSKRERWPFPRTFEALKDAGVESYRFDVSTCETAFQGNHGAPLSEPLAGADRVDIAPALDAGAVAAAIQRHMLEKTPFLEFRAAAAQAGVQF